MAFDDATGLARGDMERETERRVRDRMSDFTAATAEGMIQAERGAWLSSVGSFVEKEVATRAASGVRLYTGYVIASTGAALCVTGLGWVIGVPMGVFGGDQMVAGARGLVSGEWEASATEHIATTLFGSDNARQLEEVLTVGSVGYTQYQAQRTPAGGWPKAEVYRGVNTRHVRYDQQSKGVVRPNVAWWQVYRRRSSPLEHNAGKGGTLSSPNTSWSFDRDVAINNALRPSGDGVLLRAEVPMSRLIESPQTKQTRLMHTRMSVRETEVLVRGKVVVPESDITSVSIDLSMFK